MQLYSSDVTVSFSFQWLFGYWCAPSVEMEEKNKQSHKVKRTGI